MAHGPIAVWIVECYQVLTVASSITPPPPPLPPPPPPLTILLFFLLFKAYFMLFLIIRYVINETKWGEEESGVWGVKGQEPAMIAWP